MISTPTTDGNQLVRLHRLHHVIVQNDRLYLWLWHELRARILLRTRVLLGTGLLLRTSRIGWWSIRLLIVWRRRWRWWSWLKLSHGVQRVIIYPGEIVCLTALILNEFE